MIYVRRSVVSASRRLEALADSDNETSPLDLAEEKVGACLAAGDRTGMKFWRRVWVHLMVEKYTPGGVHVVEDDSAAIPALHNQIK